MADRPQDRPLQHAVGDELGLGLKWQLVETGLVWGQIAPGGNRPHSLTKMQLSLLASKEKQGDSCDSS